MSRWKRKLRNVWRYGIWIRLPARFVINLRSPIRGYRRPKPYTGQPIDLEAFTDALKDALVAADAEPFARFHFNQPVRSQAVYPIRKENAR